MRLLGLVAVIVALWLIFKGMSQSGDAAAPSGKGTTGPDGPPADPLDMAAAIARKWEGYSSTAYPDGGGMSIGIGHHMQPGEGYPDGVTQDQAEAMFQADMASAGEAVSRYVTVPLQPNQWAALTDFVFNEGAGKFQDSTLLKDVNSGDQDGVIAEFMKRIYSGGQPSDTLAQRRAQEALLWNEGS